MPDFSSPNWVIEAGTPEAVAFRLMQRILPTLEKQGKEEILKLYAECLATVRGPIAEDLLNALNFEE